MKKFPAVVKHEYKKVVMKWSFLIGTLLFPFLAAMFAVVPAIIFSMRGEPTRIVVVDPADRIATRLKENLAPEKIAEKARQAAKDSIGDLTASQEEKMKRTTDQLGESFVFVEYFAEGKSADQIRRELNGRIADSELDAYLIVPEDLGANARFEFYSRKAGDFVTTSTLQDAVNDAVRARRLSDANISEERLRDLSRGVKLETKKIDDTGTESESDSTFIAAFIIGLMIYLVLAIYGQAIMAAVVEEKETRIAEILFSSARPFTLMFGKLVGVGLAGLTQLGIWVISGSVLVAVVMPQLDSAGVSFPMPVITPLMIVYFLIFFLLGFFIYASIFALIGSMVTSVQEGGQFAFPPIMILLIAFYFSFAVIRDPNSTLSFWVSIAPFFAPITMPVRILADSPPFWQIALSISVNVIAIAGLVWLAARVYRVGMLMYGKRATIPEVLKWIRQR